MLSQQWTETEIVNLNILKYGREDSTILDIIAILHLEVAGQSAWDFNHLKSIADILLMRVSMITHNANYIKKEYQKWQVYLQTDIGKGRRSLKTSNHKFQMFQK